MEYIHVDVVNFIYFLFQFLTFLFALISYFKILDYVSRFPNKFD